MTLVRRLVMATRAASVLSIGSWLLGAGSAAAQPVAARPRATAAGPRLRPELRVDAFAGSASGAQLGVGVAADAGTYARFALIAAAGVQHRSRTTIGVQRAEGVLRLHVDPFRSAKVGWYVGGGVGAEHVVGSPLRPMLVAVLGLERVQRHGVATALEAGVGGGARVGIAVRRSRVDRR